MSEVFVHALNLITNHDVHEKIAKRDKLLRSNVRKNSNVIYVMSNKKLRNVLRVARQSE